MKKEYRGYATWEMRRTPTEPERCVVRLDKTKDSAPDMPTKEDIDTFARCLFPAIKAYYESEESQREFAEWKKQQVRKGKK